VSTRAGERARVADAPFTWLLRQALQQPAADLRPGSRPDESDSDGRILACGVCLAAVTSPAERMVVAGSHTHSFENPHGIAFHIGCFRATTGCVTVGDASTFFTWFPGHTWQVAVCARCRQHLGWLFRSGEGRFHGLILDRLVELDEPA